MVAAVLKPHRDVYRGAWSGRDQKVMADATDCTAALFRKI
jgi:hypothetical protein